MQDENTLYEMTVEGGQDWVFVWCLALNVHPEINCHRLVDSVNPLILPVMFAVILIS